jgi:hypothetical protein
MAMAASSPRCGHLPLSSSNSQLVRTRRPPPVTVSQSSISNSGLRRCAHCAVQLAFAYFFAGMPTLNWWRHSKCLPPTYVVQHAHPHSYPHSLTDTSCKIRSTPHCPLHTLSAARRSLYASRRLLPPALRTCPPHVTASNIPPSRHALTSSACNVHTHDPTLSFRARNAHDPPPACSREMLRGAQLLLGGTLFRGHCCCQWIQRSRPSCPLARTLSGAALGTTATGPMARRLTRQQRSAARPSTWSSRASSTIYKSSRATHNAR